MITKSMWCGWKNDVTRTYSLLYNDRFSHDESYMAWLLILFVGLTPIVLMVDLIALPIEIIYFIALKIVRRVRNNE